MGEEWKGCEVWTEIEKVEKREREDKGMSERMHEF